MKIQNDKARKWLHNSPKSISTEGFYYLEGCKPHDILLCISTVGSDYTKMDMCCSFIIMTQLDERNNEANTKKYIEGVSKNVSYLKTSNNFDSPFLKMDVIGPSFQI